MKPVQKDVIQIARARLAQARRSAGVVDLDVLGRRLAWNAIIASAGNDLLRGRALWLLGWTLGQLVGQGFTPEEIASLDGLDAIEAMLVVATMEKRRNANHVDRGPEGPRVGVSANVDGVRTPGGRFARTRMFQPSGAGRPLSTVWTPVYEAARVELESCFDPAGKGYERR